MSSELVCGHLSVKSVSSLSNNLQSTHTLTHKLIIIPFLLCCRPLQFFSRTLSCQRRKSSRERAFLISRRKGGCTNSRRTFYFSKLHSNDSSLGRNMQWQVMINCKLRPFEKFVLIFFCRSGRSQAHQNGEMVRDGYDSDDERRLNDLGEK